MTLRIILADDERTARRGLRQMLGMLEGRLPHEIVGEARNGEEALALASSLEPDVLLLDIRMPGLDGVEVARLLADQLRPLVIFVTAHDEYAVTAFERAALDYLLKPFTEERLLVALRRAQEKLQAVRAQPARTASYPAQFLAKVGRHARILRADDICAVEAAANYVYLHTPELSGLLRATLSDFENELDPTAFIRTHRSWIVRISAIAEMRKVGGGDVRLRMNDDSEVPLSRNFRPAFEERLGRIP
jgi:two-component system, LytTR family, response regulator